MPAFYSVVFPVKFIEYGVSGDLITANCTYARPYSIYLRGAICKGCIGSSGKEHGIYQWSM